METMIKIGNQQTYSACESSTSMYVQLVCEGPTRRAFVFNNTDILVFKIGLFYKRKTWHSNTQQFKLVLFYTYPDTTILKKNNTLNIDVTRHYFILTSQHISRFL